MSRNGRELVFDSNRAGGHGGFDIYVSTRHDVASPWSSPVNLGPDVNSAANDTRPSLSWDQTRLYVGSNRDRSEGGSSDLYVAERGRTTGPSGRTAHARPVSFRHTHVSDATFVADDAAVVLQPR